MSLFFMRHTQSEANLQDLLGGQEDYPLTAQGLLDAQNIACEFHSCLQEQNTVIHKIISSPLPRARQTAQQMAPILGLNPQEICFEPLLTEQAMGKFTSLSYAQLQNETDYVHDRTQRWDWQPKATLKYSGESYQQIAKRVSLFFENFSKIINGDIQKQNVLIVSHAVTLRLVYGYLCDMFPNYLERIPNDGEIWQVDNIIPNQNNLIQHYFYQGNSSSKV